MNAVDEPILLAKLTWQDPETGEARELILAEGATASIGRLETNDICIREQHVSRQHAIIKYSDGVFLISDLGSANGVYVNDQRLSEAFPLASGDEIRLYVPLLRFEAVMDEESQRQATAHGARLSIKPNDSGGSLTITNGTQEGERIALLVSSVSIGRATNNADWDVCLQDSSVSRPHARLDLIDTAWVLYDLGSVNGTLINGTSVTEKGRVVHDGDLLTFAGTTAIFHTA